MPLNFYIYDRTNDWKRAEGLRDAIVSRKHNCIELRALLSEDTEADVVLFHSSNFGANTPALLEKLAAKGKVVVAYTAGQVTSATTNLVHQRSFVEVERLLNWLTEAWTLDDVTRALDLEWAEDQSRGFTALAILAQGAAANGLRGVARKRQISWQTNQQPWRRVLGMTGLALLRERAEKDGKRDAAALLSWIDTGGTSPDFVAAAKEAAELAG